MLLPTSLLILYIYLMCFLYHNKLLFMHSVTRKYNFINIVKNVKASLFEVLFNFLTNHNFGGGAPPVLPTTSLVWKVTTEQR